MDRRAIALLYLIVILLALSNGQDTNDAALDFVGPVFSNTGNNDAETILEEAIRDFRSRAASAAQQRNDSERGDVLDMIVRANDGGSGAKFEFIPHFERNFFEFMIPEGVSGASSVVAIVDFIGALGAPAPHFQIDADAMRLFEIGTIEAVQNPNYVLYHVPIMQRADARVDATQIPERVYLFKIMATQNGHVSAANVKAELLTAMKRIAAADMTAATEATTTPAEERIADGDLATMMSNGVAEGAGITFTMEADAADRALGGGLLAPRSATSPDDFIDPTTDLAEKSTEIPAGTEIQNQIKKFHSSAPQAEASDANQSDIDAANLLDAAEHGDSAAMALLDGAIPKELLDEMALADPLLAFGNATVDDLIEPSAQKEESQPHLTATAGGGVHVHDAQEAAAPHEPASQQANAQSPETLISGADQSPASPGEDEAATVEFVQDQPPADFSSLGFRIEFNGGAENGTITVPRNAMPLDTIEGADVRIVQSDDGDAKASEMLELQVSPPGVIDVRPHFVLPGQHIAFVLVEPSLLQPEDGTERRLKFTLECTFAKLELRAELPSGLIASRTFTVETESQGTSGASRDGLRFAEPRYEFHVSENASSGAIVGRVALQSENSKGGAARFELRGIGAEKFRIDDQGKINLACPEATAICLDADKFDGDILHLVAVATTSSEVAAVPVTVRVQDVNDNAPMLRVFDTEVHVVDDELPQPFFVLVVDADATPAGRHGNALELDGSAAEFLVGERLSDSLWQIRPFAFASAGIYTLVLRARDATAANKTSGSLDDTAQITVIVKGESPKVRFSKAVYERTVSSDRLNKGNPLIQLELKGVPSSTVSYVILDGNPGWLAIESYGGHVYVGDVPRHNINSGRYMATVGAVEQDTRKILAKCQLAITVAGSPQNIVVLQKSFYSILTSKDSGMAAGPGIARKFALADVLGNGKQANALRIIDGSVRAYDDAGKRIADPLGFTLSLDDHNDVLVHSPAGQRGQILANVQQILFQLQNAENERDKALVGISLSSQAQAVLDRLRAASRPQFAAPWTNDNVPIKLRIPEEFPQNHVLLRLPARNPLSGNAISNFTLSGAAARFFSIDPTTATIQIQERIDYESLSVAEQRALILEVHARNAPEEERSVFGAAEGADALARLEVRIFDVDDTPPTLNLTSGTRRVIVAESARTGDTLATFTARDPDSLKLMYHLTGDSADALDNFRIQQRGDEHAITIAENARLDREMNDRYALVVTCVDPAGNRDQLELEVLVSDENDNRPLFTSASSATTAIHTFDNWPAGVVLARFEAHDRDAGENARISYALAADDRESEPYFSIDNTTGVLRTARALAGLATGQRPYALSVIATDAGQPSFSSTTHVDVFVSDAAQSSDFDDATLRIVEPPAGFTLELPEDTPVGRKVFTVEASVGLNARNLPTAMLYSLTATGARANGTNEVREDGAEDGALRIDPATGDVFTAAPLDYERQRFLTLSAAASIGLGQHQRRDLRSSSEQNLNRDDQGTPNVGMITLEDRFDSMLDRVRTRLTASMRRPKRSASMNLLNSGGAGDDQNSERSVPLRRPRAPSTTAATTARPTIQDRKQDQDKEQVHYLDGYDFRKFGYSTRRNPLAQAAAAFDKKKRGTSLRTRRSMRRRFNATSGGAPLLLSVSTGGGAKQPLAPILKNHFVVYAEDFDDDNISNNHILGYNSENKPANEDINNDNNVFEATKPEPPEHDHDSIFNGDKFLAPELNANHDDNEANDNSMANNDIGISHDSNNNNKPLSENHGNKEDAESSWSADLRVLERSLLESIKRRTAAATAHMRQARDGATDLPKDPALDYDHLEALSSHSIANRRLGLIYDAGSGDFAAIQSPYRSLQDVNSGTSDPSPGISDGTGDMTPLRARKTRNRYGGYVPPELRAGGTNRDSIGLDDVNAIRRRSDDALDVTSAYNYGYSANMAHSNNAYGNINLHHSASGKDHGGYNSNYSTIQEHNYSDRNLVSHSYDGHSPYSYSNHSNGSNWRSIPSAPTPALESGYSSGGYSSTMAGMTSSPSPPLPSPPSAAVVSAPTARLSDEFQLTNLSLKSKLDILTPVRVEIPETEPVKTVPFTEVSAQTAEASPKKGRRGGLSSLKIFKIFSPSSEKRKTAAAAASLSSPPASPPSTRSRGFVISPRLKRRANKSHKLSGAPNETRGGAPIAAKSLQALPTSERDADDGEEGELSGALARIPGSQRLFRFASAAALSSAGASDAAIEFLQARVKETKYVTAVFESAGGGLAPILPDITAEFGHWLGARSRLLAVACEVHWSVPEAYRSRAVEIKMKDSLHRALRDNNRRVLNLYDECRRGLPVSFIESKTEESCARDAAVDAFQGIYRRYYPDLLALQDPRTIVSHRSHWMLDALCDRGGSAGAGGRRRPPLEPAPARFLPARSLSSAQLARKSVVAINMATLRLADDATDYDAERAVVNAASAKAVTAERRDVLI